MKHITYRVLQRDSNDFCQILDLKHGYGQNNLDDRFWGMATWVTPFITPYWECGEFSERQKRAFKSESVHMAFFISNST